MDFVRRNSPIFIIGFLTLIIFLIIIATAQKKPITQPELIEVNESELIDTHTQVLGDPNSPITIVEFSDFGCPACKSFHPIVEEIVTKHPGLIKWAYRHYPLPQHKDADKAAAAAQAAGEQGRFWEYGKILFANQGEFSKSKLMEYAEQLSLNTQKFEEDIESGNFDAQVETDLKYGKQLGVTSTPTFFLNGKQMDITSYDNFIQQILTAINKEVGQPQNVNETTESLQMTNYQEIDQKFPQIEIKYTESGFDPKGVEARKGQLVKWTNTTSTAISIEQLVKKFDVFSNPVTIAPGSSFTLRLTDSKLWTYKEQNTQHFGSIFIQEL